MTAPYHQQVATAYATAARLVDQHGEQYLPFFEMMEQEMIRIESKSSAMERARAAAGSQRFGRSISGEHAGEQPRLALR